MDGFHSHSPASAGQSFGLPVCLPAGVGSMQGSLFMAEPAPAQILTQTVAHFIWIHIHIRESPIDLLEFTLDFIDIGLALAHLFDNHVRVLAAKSCDLA